MKSKVIKIPLYRGNLVLIASGSPKKIRKIIPDFKGRKGYVYATTYRFNHNETRGYGIVLNFKNSYSKLTHGTISHEALHAANFIADNAGILSDFDNDEPITYLIQWIVDEIHLFCKENNLKVHVKM